jgi:sodium transport system ATP-binding protein
MIEVEALSKQFLDPKTKAPIQAVAEASFVARPGEIFGLLGPNGAGKTTLIRMLATILTPTSGTARIQGHDIARAPQQVRASIGYLTGSAALYERLTVREALSYFADLYGLSSAEKNRRIAALAQTLEMEEFLDRRCDKLSTGQRQRASIARSVLHQPPVLFFDEPTSGLDVMAARTVVRFIKQCRSEGKTVIFSTHIMSEVEALCDRIAVVYQGRICAQGTRTELQQQTRADANTPFETVFLRLIGENEEEAVPGDGKGSSAHEAVASGISQGVS